MTEMNEEAPRRPLSWLEHIGDLVRLVQLFFVIAIAVIVFLRDNSPGNRCGVSAVLALLTSAVSQLVPPELAGNVEKITKACASDPDERHIADVAMKLIEAKATSDIAPAVIPSTPQPSKSTTAATISTGAAGATVPTSGTTLRNGWVAVGYIKGDLSFEITGGRPVEALAAGDTMTARQPVNLRKGAADWSNPIGIVPAKARVKVVETPKTLAAGSLQQVWAHVEFE